MPTTGLRPAVLRPRDAAAYIGVSLPSFWRYARIDPTCPEPFQLGGNATGVMREDLDRWLQSKRDAAREGAR